MNDKENKASSGGERKADVDDRTKNRYRKESVHEGAKDKDDKTGSPESGIGGS